MICPKCGYMMDAFEKECPRCKTFEEKQRETILQDLGTEITQPIIHRRSRVLTILAAAIGGTIVGTGIIVVFMTGHTPRKTPARTPPRPTTPVTSIAPTPTRTPPVPVAQPMNMPADTLTPQQIARQSFPSVVTLGANDLADDLVLGSGFFVEDGLIATNKHVVGEASVALAWITNHASDDYLKAKHIIAGDNEKDIALLEVEPGAAPPLPMADLSNIEVGDTVYALGSPKGLEGTMSAGMISNIHRNDDGSIASIQISAPISHGSSGGPVVNIRGEVIGLSTAGMIDGQNLNFAVPVTDLRKLITAYHNQVK